LLRASARASGRNIDRRQHNEHAEDGEKHDARIVRCHDVLLTCASVVTDVGMQRQPVCDLRHIFALLGGVAYRCAGDAPNRLPRISKSVHGGIAPGAQLVAHQIFSLPPPYSQCQRTAIHFGW
jgi:hypothetical protein